MRNWLAENFREAPLLMAAVALYLGLSAVEAARNVIVSDPIDAGDIGLSPWENVVLPGTDARLLVRWSSPSSIIRRTIGGPVLGLTVYRPGDAEGQVAVTFEIDGQPLDAYTFGTGVYTFHYYLPAILPAATWAEARERLADRARREAARASGRWLGQWRELQPWRPSAAPPSVRIGVTLTPRDGRNGLSEAATNESREGATPATGMEDARKGRQPWVGIATVLWLEELAPSGSGFHGEERDADGTTVSWTRQWASRPLEAAGAEGLLRMRAVHPDIARDPVRVRLFWNDQPSGGVSLTSPDWTWVPFTVPGEGAAGVLTINVDRTWSPLRAGASADGRELGVLIGGLRWRR